MRSPTSSGVAAGRRLTILGVHWISWVLILAGCSADPISFPVDFQIDPHPQRDVGPAELVGDSRSRPVRREERPIERTDDPIDPAMGDDTAPQAASPEAEIPVVEGPPEETITPDPPEQERLVDPGAAELVRSILQSLPMPERGEDGMTRIGVSSLRNQSRSTRDEFTDLLRFLTDELSRAGRDRRVLFTDAEEAEVQYRLQGAGYRIGHNDHAQWELFLGLQQDEDGLLIWEAPGPVQVTISDDPEKSGIEIRN